MADCSIKSEPRQFRLRTLFSVTTLMTILVGLGFQPLQAAWKQGGGLFLLPYHLLGVDFRLVAESLFFLSPLAFGIALFRITQNKPAPVTAWAFLACLTVGVASLAVGLFGPLVSSTGYYPWLAAISAAMFLCFGAIVGEAIVRRLCNQKPLIFCCAALAVAYWFTACMLVIARD